MMAINDCVRKPYLKRRTQSTRLGREVASKFFLFYFSKKRKRLQTINKRQNMDNGNIKSIIEVINNLNYHNNFCYKFFYYILFIIYYLLYLTNFIYIYFLLLLALLLLIYQYNITTHMHTYIYLIYTC